MPYFGKWAWLKEGLRGKWAMLKGALYGKGGVA